MRTAARWVLIRRLPIICFVMLICNLETECTAGRIQRVSNSLPITCLGKRDKFEHSSERIAKSRPSVPLESIYIISLPKNIEPFSRVAPLKYFDKFSLAEYFGCHNIPLSLYARTDHHFALPSGGKYREGEIRTKRVIFYQDCPAMRSLITWGITAVDFQKRKMDGFRLNVMHVVAVLVVMMAADANTPEPTAIDQVISKRPSPEVPISGPHKHVDRRA